MEKSSEDPEHGSQVRAQSSETPVHRKRRGTGGFRLAKGLTADFRLRRQENRELAPLAGRRFDADAAAVLVDDAMADAQAKSGADALRLGRKKGIEDLLTNRRVDAATIVDDVDFDAARRCRGADDDLAAFATGVDRIGDQVEHDLVHLRRITSDRRQGRELRFNVHLPAFGLAADDVERRFDGGVHIHALLEIAELAGAGEAAQVEDDLLDAFEPFARALQNPLQIAQRIADVYFGGARLNHARKLRRLLGYDDIGLLVKGDQLAQRLQVALQDGDVVGDERQRIVDLVGDAGDELPQRGQLGRLHELGLRPLQLFVRLLQIHACLAFGLGQPLQRQFALFALHGVAQAAGE